MQTQLPECRSSIPGFHILPPELKSHPNADEIVTLAKLEFIITKVKVDGSNPSYFLEDEFQFAMFFVKDDEDLTVFRQKDSNTIIMTFRKEDQVKKVEISERLEEVDSMGAVLVVWTQESGDEPYFELHLSKPTVAN